MKEMRCSFCGPIRLMEGEDTCPNCGTKIVGDIESVKNVEGVKPSHKPTWAPDSWR